MTLKTSLYRVSDDYLNEIVNIRDFVKSTEKTLTHRQKVKLKDADKERFADELRKLIDFINQENDGRKKNGSRSIPIKSDDFAEFLLQKLIPMTHKKFLNEMTLTYLISYQEAFIKDYLFQILINRKNLLKSSAKITSDEILNYSSMKALKEALAQKEVDSIGYESIDGVCDYFLKKFNVNLSDFTNWSLIREASYRRNLIVHNRGVTNETYCTKIGYKHRKKQLKTDYEYILKVAQSIMDFIVFVHSFFLKKFKLERQKN